MQFGLVSKVYKKPDNDGFFLVQITFIDERGILMGINKDVQKVFHDESLYNNNRINKKKL